MNVNETSNLIKNFNGKVYDLCYKLLQQGEDNKEVFEYACKNLLKLPELGTIEIDKYFSDDEISEYDSLYEDTVVGILGSTIKRCNFGSIRPEDFYSALWDSYCGVLSTPKEKAYAFYRTLQSPQIPYQYLGRPLSMSNERFKELTDRNEESIQKIRYIVRSDYRQRTERASLLLNCIQEIDDYESKIVVLAHGISIMGDKKKRPSRKEIEELIERIDSKRAKEDASPKEKGSAVEWQEF